MAAPEASEGNDANSIERNYYERVRCEPDFFPKLISGTLLDRISGLEPLIRAARDASILDLGCHKGFVALEFAKAGSAVNSPSASAVKASQRRSCCMVTSLVVVQDCCSNSLTDRKPIRPWPLCAARFAHSPAPLHCFGSAQRVIPK